MSEANDGEIRNSYLNTQVDRDRWPVIRDIWHVMPRSNNSTALVIGDPLIGTFTTEDHSNKPSYAIDMGPFNALELKFLLDAPVGAGQADFLISALNVMVDTPQGTVPTNSLLVKTNIIAGGVSEGTARVDAAAAAALPLTQNDYFADAITVSTSYQPGTGESKHNLVFADTNGWASLWVETLGSMMVGIETEVDGAVVTNMQAVYRRLRIQK